MEYPFPKWRGKPVLLSRHAAEGILNENISVQKILETLEYGVESKQKRGAGVFEFLRAYKNDVLKVVVADNGDNWKVITVIKFSR